MLGVAVLTCPSGIIIIINYHESLITLQRTKQRLWMYLLHSATEFSMVVLAPSLKTQGSLMLLVPSCIQANNKASVLCKKNNVPFGFALALFYINLVWNLALGKEILRWQIIISVFARCAQGITRHLCFFPTNSFSAKSDRCTSLQFLSLPLLAPSAALAVGFSCGMALQKNESYTSPATHQKSHAPLQQWAQTTRWIVWTLMNRNCFSSVLIINRGARKALIGGARSPSSICALE